MKSSNGPRSPDASQEHPAPARNALPIEIRNGSIEVRLAQNDAEVGAAQELRYRVFYEEMGARASADVAAHGRDQDRFDSVADHLLVIDHDTPEVVVGTYRIMRRAVAREHGGFYTAQEFDIGKLLAEPGEIMEVGRSCVDVQHRTRTAMQMLWKGLAAYVFQYRIETLFGCASLPGADIDRHAETLSYLHHHCLAPPELCPRALEGQYVGMDRVEPDRIDTRSVQAKLPPLIRGYLRLGGWVGDGAVVDRQFNTTDVCIVVRTESVTDRYFRHYTRTVRDTMES